MTTERHPHRRGGGAGIAVAGLLVGWLAVQTACAAGSHGHCAPDETVLFSCSTGSKTVSVCADPKLSAQEGWVEYRFGPIGAPELVLPSTRSHPRATVQAGTWAYSGGGGAFMLFPGAPYAYAVYTAIGKGWREKEGVAVLKQGHRVANLPCRAPARSELGPDLFDQAGLEDQPDAFELP